MYSIFQRLCELRNIKPAQVAKDTGISKATLSEWKKGTYTPKSAKLQKIADYFGVTIDYLMTGEDSSGYYKDPETAKLAQRLLSDPGFRALMDAAEDADPENVKLAAEMLQRMKRTNPDG